MCPTRTSARAPSSPCRCWSWRPNAPIAISYWASTDVTRTIDITWPRGEGKAGLFKALDRICAEGEAAIDEGDSLVVLSDARVGAERIAVSTLLAVGAVLYPSLLQDGYSRSFALGALCAGGTLGIFHATQMVPMAMGLAGRLGRFGA